MGVGDGFGAVTGVLGCLAVFASDGASHAAQSVLAMRVIDAVVVWWIWQSLVCEAVAVRLFLRGGCFGSFLTAVPFLFWFWFCGWLAALHRYRLDLPFCCRNSQRDSRGQRRRLLGTYTLCCVGAAHIMALLFDAAVRPSSLVCWQRSADTL